MVLELNSTHFIFTYMVALVVKNLRASAGNVRDTVSVPGLERSPGGGHGNLLQYSGASHGQKSLAHYSLWRYKELDTTEVTELN